MRELFRAIPDADTLYGLEPEELAVKLLFLIPQYFHRERTQMISIGVITGELDQLKIAGSSPYPDNSIGALKLAIREAWAWLEAQGLLIPAEGTNGQNGWRELSRRARNFQNEQDFARFQAARRLPREALHERIAEKVWQAFMRGEFDVAVFQATKAVEIAVREAAGLPAELVGVKLMRTAFHPETGKLTDMEAEGGERDALKDLFAGAMGVFKNPQSHRYVDWDDPQRAIEIILLSNHLLHIVDERALRNAQ